MSDTQTPAPPVKSKRKEIASRLVRFPPAALERVDAAAKSAGISANAFIVAAAKEKAARSEKAVAAPVEAAKPRLNGTPIPPPGSRLDKSSIGKRVGPKKSAKAHSDEGEAV